MSHWTNPALLAGRRIKPSFKNLAKLFNGGAVDGVMIDLTDTTTLFQDVNGAVPVTANAHPIGLALDQHKWGGKALSAYRASQPELITNPDFASDVSGWSVSGTGSISWVSGKLRLTTSSGSPYFYQSVSTVAGRWYELTVVFDVRAGTGNLDLLIGTGVQGAQNLSATGIFTAPGTYRRWFKATATTTFITIRNVSGTTSSDWESVSVKEIDGHHATSLTTARPLWQSATSDVLFDGSNDYLSVGDFDFPAGDCFLAAWAKSNTQNRAIAGVVQSTIYMALFHQTGGLLYSAVGSSTPMTGSVTSGGVYHTLLADKNAANANFIADGVLQATKATPGSTATTGDMAIGGWNSTGTPGAFLAGNIKRIVAGQVRVQDTMTAADFHANLIA